MKLELSLQILEKKSSNVKFDQNSSGGNRVNAEGKTDGRTDGHDEVNSRFSEFCERALK